MSVVSENFGHLSVVSKPHPDPLDTQVTESSDLFTKEPFVGINNPFSPEIKFRRKGFCYEELDSLIR